MSLRSKIAMVLFAAVTVFLSVDHFLESRTFSARFEDLDKGQAIKHMGHARGVVALELTQLADAAERLSTQLPPYAQWETQREQIEAELPRVLRSQPLHVVVVHDAQGQVHMHRILDPSTGEEIALPSLPNEGLSPSNPLTLMWSPGDAAAASSEQQCSCIVPTERGALLLSSLTIQLTAEDQMHLSVGRFLDPPFLERMRYHSGSELNVVVLGDGRLPVEDQALLQRLETAGLDILVEDAEAGFAVSALLRGVAERPALLLKSRVQHKLVDVWADLKAYTLLSRAALIVLFPLAILLLLQVIVTGPLGKLTAHAVAIGRTPDTGERLDLQRGDEIGQLGGEFDSMLDKLAASRLEVMESARLAGMSQVSGEVLHHVGNSLNSVSVAAELARSHVEQLPLEDLQRINSALKNGSLDGQDIETHMERLASLQLFIEAVFDKSEFSAQSARNEIAAMEESIAHIVSMLGTLETTRPADCLLEEVDLDEAVDSVLELGLASVPHAENLVIQRDYSITCPLRLDRHKLMGALFNLVRNALESISDAELAQPVLHVAIQPESEGMSIHIRDEGLGIDSADLDRIFHAGHSSKPDAAGLGLHMAANSATGLGGSLTVQSPGPGLGATFSLLLPYAPLSE